LRKSIGLNVAVLVIAMYLQAEQLLLVTRLLVTHSSGPHFNINIIGHPKDYKGSRNTAVVTPL
jgi:hypothetical protein